MTAHLIFELEVPHFGCKVSMSCNEVGKEPFVIKRFCNK